MAQEPQESFQAYLDRTRDVPIYVVLGVQGSGTNLISRLLTRIFNFSIMQDRSLVFNAGARLGNTPTPEAIAREVETVRNYIFPTAWRRKTSKYAIKDNQASSGMERELRAEVIGSGAALARFVYGYRGYSLGTTRIGVKSDDIWEHLDAIDEVLPNRRIILITRDFRDNLVSITGKSFGPADPVKAAYYVKERISRYAAEYRRHPGRAYHVSFSTLVNSPRTFVESLANHFDLAPAVDPDAVIAAFPFRAGKLEKWRTLPADQLAWCEGILYDELEEFGYTPTTPAPVMPAASDILAASFRDTAQRVPQKLRTLVERMKK